jgi:hypothetical protein
MSTRARAIDTRQLAFGFSAGAGPRAVTALLEVDERSDHSPVVVERGEKAMRSVAHEPRRSTASASVPTALPGLARPKTKLLEEAIRRGLGPHAKVLITDNKSTLISRTKKGDQWTVRIHQMFLEGGQPLFDDIGRWLGRGDAAAAKRIDDYIAAREHILDHHARPLDDDAGRGVVHDLVEIMHRVNTQHFDPHVRAEITWGQGVRRGRRSTITLGTFDERARRITIHAVLDQPFVPEIAVARVVHHEMLHAVFPPVRGDGGRRIVHGEAFRRAEGTFRDATEADRWLDANLDRLLGQKTGRRARASAASGSRAWQIDDSSAEETDT